MPDNPHEDLLDAFIADQTAPASSDPIPIRSMDATTMGRLARRGLPWIIGGGLVYLLAPAVLGVLAASDQLVEIDWYWLLALLAAQGAVLYLTWVLQRLLIDGSSGNRTPLALIASTQLVGNAVATAAPFGGAAGTAAQVRALARRGVDPRRATAGIIAFSLLQVASIGALALVGPVMVIFGFSVPAALGRTALLGCAALGLITVLLVVLLRTDRAADWIGTAAGVVLRRDPRRIVIMLRRERRHLRRALAGPGRAPKVLGVALGAFHRRLRLPPGGGGRGQPDAGPRARAAGVRRRRGAAPDPVDPRWSRTGGSRAHPVARRGIDDAFGCGARHPRLPGRVAVDPAALRPAGDVVAAPPHSGEAGPRPFLSFTERPVDRWSSQSRRGSTIERSTGPL